MKPDMNEMIDDLALLVDGDPEALEKWADALADSEHARDLRFEAAKTAQQIADAGADFEVPEDLEQRILAAVDARGGSAQSERQPEPPPGGGVPQTHAHADTLVDPASGLPAPRKSNRFLIGGLVAGGLVAIAAAFAVVVGLDAFQGEDGEILSADALSATIATIVRSADGEGPQVSGVVAENPGAPLTGVLEGSALPAGSRIVTDPRTRARLELSDGSVLIVNQDTELVLGSNPRTIELKRGEILAEVAHLENGPNARYETPSGVVEVIGTKFILTAGSDGHGSVRVTRGAVRVHNAGQSVEVKTGQEGLMLASVAPQVVPAVNLAGSLGWSELEGNAGDDAPIAGLGELRAHRPGEREEQERPLSLSNHRVSVRVVGNVARTEIEETFSNESNEVLEGVYRFPLPPDARIASLALEVDGQWEEGAFVPKERARQIWRGVIRNATPEPQRQQEEFIWVPGPWRDPALLEWQQGGRFELRIFPIPANGSRSIRLSYEQTVQPHGEGRRYVYPLAHAEDDSTRVGHFEVDVRVAGEGVQAKSRGYELATTTDDGAQRLRYAQNDFRPSGDLVIDYSSPGDRDSELRYWGFRGQAVAAPATETREDQQVNDAQRALHADDRGYVMFALRPELPGWTEAEHRDYVLVVDSSQSMVGERYERATRLAMGVVGEMDRRDRVMVMACDVECRAMEGDPLTPSSHTVASVREFLDKRDPAGASDLTATMREAVEIAGRFGAGNQRTLHVVYIGDGTSTVGHRRAGSLAAEMSEIFEGKGALTTVGIGQEADTVALRAMARAGRGHYVPFVPGQRTGAAAMAVLETTFGVSLDKATLELPAGIVEVAPTALSTIRAGEEVIITGRLTSNQVRGEAVLRGNVGGRSFEQRYPIEVTASTSAGNAFVPRQWASKTIEGLELGGRSEDVMRIVALSKGYGVMSRSTSLLVLESEAMFRAFGVDRARPTLQWTGDEDSEMGEASGTTQLQASVAQLGTLGGLAGGGRAAGPSAMSAPRTSARAARPMNFAAADEAAEPSPAAGASAAAPLDDVLDARDREERQTVRARRAPRRPGRFMRKVWFREGRIDRSSPDHERDMAAVREAEEALRAQPDSRDRHRTLVRALSRAGRLERAEQVAKQWIERDRLDPEALTYLSDVVGRLGRRDEAVRLLSGIVDLESDNVTLQRRMANAFERAGKAERACAHRVALAEIRPGDRDVVADAMRCERALGRTAAADRILEMVDADDRDDVTEAAADAATAERVRGDLIVEAEWTGGSDVDVTLVTPQGTRLSWMGGRTNVVGDDATRIGHERVGLRRAGTGRYYIEVNRVDEHDRSPIRGQLNIRALGETQRIPFELTEARASVGSVRVVRRWRLQ